MAFDKRIEHNILKKMAIEFLFHGMIKYVLGFVVSRPNFCYN